MAHLNSHKAGGWRIKYRVYFPTGEYIEKAKYSTKKTFAAEIFREAERLETLTRRHELSPHEGRYFLNISLISENEYTRITGIKPLCDIPWSELKTAWEDWFEKRSRPSTLKVYKQKFTPILDILEKYKVNEVTVKLLEEYQSERMNTTSEVRPKKVGSATVNRDFQIIRPLLDIAVEKGALSSNPARQIKDLPENDGRIPRSLYMDELKRFFKTLEAHKHLCYGHIKEIIFVGLYTGLRLGEILNLLKASIRLDHKRITIQPHGKGADYWRPKSKKGTRIVEIHNDLVPLLKPFLKTDGPYIFGKLSGDKWAPLVHPNSLSHIVKFIIKKAELPEDITFHCLRHSWVSYALDGGAPLIRVKHMAGHESIETTMKYTHAQPSASLVDCLPSFVKIYKEAQKEKPVKAKKAAKKTTPKLP